MEKNKISTTVCVCVRARLCVRVCVRACVCERERKTEGKNLVGVE